MNVENTQKVQIEPSWHELLKDEFEKEYFVNLKNFLKSEKENYTIYPPGSKIFSAFNHTPVDKVKVVIIGQDPYHGAGQANGLCFSVSDGIKQPPSLVNIFKELQADLGIAMPKSGNLEKWADQGVLLLNATLTVRANQAGSHQKRGWEEFTDTVIKRIAEKKTGLIFLLWGKFAQDKAQLIDAQKHFILKAAHPSPFSAHNGFLGSKHFSKTNEILLSTGKDVINWKIE
jgi:uracil-DNA glycosylase